MANEVAAIIELLGDKGDPVRFTCATAIAKGTVLKMTSPRTVAACTADDEPIAGIAAMETDGTETVISVYTNGIFDIYSGAGMTLGAMVAVDAANDFKDADATDLLQGSVLGQSLETNAGSAITAVRVLK